MNIIETFPLFRGFKEDMLRVSLFLALLPFSLAAADLSEVKTLMDSKRLPEAKPILEKIVASEPDNADALFQLGRCMIGLGKREEAIPLLEKARSLQPKRVDIMVVLGGAYMDEAGRQSSLSLCRKGRSTLEAALEIEETNIKAHEILFGFFSNAPWIAGGSTDKAYRHAQAIRTQNPQRGLMLTVALKNKEKKYSESFALCSEALKQNPNDFTAHYEFGRTATISGERSDEALVLLEKSLQLAPPPNMPGFAGVHYRIGQLLQTKGDKAKAAEHYELGLKIEPNNKQLLEALAKLK